jgi:hypothetical protein
MWALSYRFCHQMSTLPPSFCNPLSPTEVRMLCPTAQSLVNWVFCADSISGNLMVYIFYCVVTPLQMSPLLFILRNKDMEKSIKMYLLVPQWCILGRMKPTCVLRERGRIVLEKKKHALWMCLKSIVVSLMLSKIQRNLGSHITRWQ